MNAPTKLLILTVTLLISGNGWAKVPAEHQSISGPFKTPMELTKTCLECHQDASAQVMTTPHWTWEMLQVVGGKEVMRGKKNVINNFCVGLAGNYPRCTSCHAGYGWKDEKFDFTDQSRVDCLVCHDTTGSYMKPADAPAGAGMPPGYTGNPKFDQKPYDLVKLAQNAGTPSRKNCLVCHANGGGGNAIKHGDIDLSLVAPNNAIDIHMAAEGSNFTCQACHTTAEHQIKGNSLINSPGSNNHLACTDCHKEAPHGEEALNRHTARIACQTCHIPTFAKKFATKMYWDWSKAQNPKNLPEDQREVKKDGEPVYSAMKGEFRYAKNVIPEYHWYNGAGNAYTIGDKIDPNVETRLNFPGGSKDDPKSKIMPFKAHRGRQIYDVKNSYLIAPKLFGPPNDPDAFWVQYDWNKAAAAGMKKAGVPYSGEYGFAPTVTYWPTNHMVAAAKDALKCADCHGQNGRLDWRALGYEGNPNPMN